MTRQGRRTSAREPALLEQIPVWGRASKSEAPADASPGGVESLLDGLNPEQRRAVCHGEGPLLVVAGAGTGKTQMITRRIAWLIATRRARPSEILALTFTDKAAEEMQARVDQLVPYGYTDAAVSTFHAFGDRLVREFALELGLPTDTRVLSRPEVVIFLRERLFEFGLDEYRPLGDPTRFLGALATLFSRCKDEDVSPQAYLDFAESLARRSREADPASLEPDEPAALAQRARREGELARAYARYQELLRAAGLIDFGDQVSLALRLLRESPAARLELQRRYRYILVDEFQDTNRAQSELVELLAAPHGNVTVVGDDDQSIYKFRGAAISNILEFRRATRASRQIVLRRNYRSRAPILDASYRLIRFNDPGPAGVPQRHRQAADRRATGQRSSRSAICAFATGLGGGGLDSPRDRRPDRIRRGSRGTSRSWSAPTPDADPVLRSLNMCGVPWRFSGTSGLYARPEIRLLLAFLRAIADLSSSVDVYALAASDVYGLGGPDLTAIVNTARRRNRSLWEVIEELTRQPGLLRLAPATRGPRWSGSSADLRRYTELAHERPAGEVLYQFLRDSGLLSRLASTDSVAAEESLQNIARFFDIVRSQSDLLPDDRVVFVARHLQTLIDAGDDPATAEVDPEADAVAVLTVHKAKGLEFPVVFMVGLVDGRFPARTRREPLALPVELVTRTLPEGRPHVQEERRLFYVGMTRARDELILTHAADYGGRRARRVSQFVLEALDLPAVGAAGGQRFRRPRGAPIADWSAAAFEPAVAGRQNPAREPGIEGPLSLSFYQVDDYLTCPLKYKYVHVLRVPIAPHHSIVYGSALHQAVQEFHRRQATGYMMSEDELLAAFEAAWSNEGFLTASTRRLALRRAGPRSAGSVPSSFSRAPSCRRTWSVSSASSWTAIASAAGWTGWTSRGSPADQAHDGTSGERPARGRSVAPSLPGLHPERVTITDYKSSDVRDPAEGARAGPRVSAAADLRHGLPGRDRTPARCGPAVVPGIRAGGAGRGRREAAREGADVDPARRRPAFGPASSRATPDYIACGYCAFRDICPASAAK